MCSVYPSYHIPFIHLSLPCIHLFTPVIHVYTPHILEYVIYTPNTPQTTPLNALHTPYIHHYIHHCMTGTNVSGTTGTRLQEGNKINESLTQLGIVIRALTEDEAKATKASPKSGKSSPKGGAKGGAIGRHHIPYRSSKLTRLLQVPFKTN